MRPGPGAMSAALAKSSRFYLITVPRIYYPRVPPFAVRIPGLTFYPRFYDPFCAKIMPWIPEGRFANFSQRTITAQLRSNWLRPPARRSDTIVLRPISFR
jgi:hypothetical protein